MNLKTLPPSHSHPAPVSRRDFLALGAISSSALLLAPRLLGAQSAFAADCAPQAGLLGSNVPFLVFDMAGGAALPGSFLVGGKDGVEDMLPSYNLLGWDPRVVRPDKRFGLPMAPQISGFFNGMTAAMSPEAQAKLRLGSLCHRAQDDSSTNPLNAIDLVMKSGYKGGDLLPLGLGTRNSLSGGNSRTGSDDPTQKPFYVNQVDALIDSLSLKAMQDLPAGTIPVVNQGVQGLGLSQWRYFSTAQRADKIRELAECFFGRLKISTGSSDVDPRQNKIFQKVYGLQPTTTPLSEDAVAAAVVYNVLSHRAGPGVITLGNCDYHTGSSTLGDQQDLNMGRQIGRAVQAAHELKSPLFFQLITDGGCSADPGTRNWRGDSGEKCMTVMGYYDPTAAPKQQRIQVGHFTSGQGAARDTVVGLSPARAAHATFANYLNISGRLDDYQRIAAGAQSISPGELESVIVFSKS